MAELTVLIYFAGYAVSRDPVFSLSPDHFDTNHFDSADSLTRGAAPLNMTPPWRGPIR